MKRSAPTDAKRQRGYTIGRTRFAKISAIEGIELTSAMDEDFREFDRRNLPAEQRRQIIVLRYGKVR